MTQREYLHKLIDRIPDERLSELEVFIQYIHHRERYPESAWFRTLHELFEPVREVASDMTEAEIDQLIADELQAVRHEHEGEDAFVQCARCRGRSKIDP